VHAVDIGVDTGCAQTGDQAERHDAPGRGVLGGNVLDRRAERGTVGIDPDAVGVAGDGRVGPDFDLGPVDADAGERNRDVDIGWKSARRGAGVAAKQAHRSFEIREVDALLDQQRRAEKARDGLVRDQGDRVDAALVRRADGIEP
jgi:hypothetical protein